MSDITVSRNPWSHRRIRNVWRAPYPYLFHPWQVNMDTGYCMSGRKRTVGKWVAEWNHLTWREDWDNRPEYEPGQMHESPVGASVPWLVHTDIDKAHRCPVCTTMAGIKDELEQYGYPGNDNHIYTCTICGQRFSRRWYLRSYPGNGDRFVNRVRLWWMWRKILTRQWFESPRRWWRRWI